MLQPYVVFQIERRMMIIRLIVSVIVVWIAIISYLIYGKYQRREEQVTHEISRQLMMRENELVNRYADRIVKLQLDLGTEETIKPQTLKDMMQVVADMVAAIDVDSAK